MLGSYISFYFGYSSGTCFINLLISPYIYVNQSKCNPTRIKYQFMDQNPMGCGSTTLKIETRGPLYIYYGTTSGNSSRLAFQFADEATKHKFIPKVINLSEFNQDQLRAAKLSVFFVSTYGSGGPTNDAFDFHDWLISEERTQDFLQDTCFTVFALGSTNHTHFCGMGIKVDQRLEFMGAKRLFPLGQGNAADETTDKDYEEWVQKGLFEALERAFPLMSMDKEQIELSVYRVKETDKAEDWSAEHLQFHAQKYMNSPQLVITEIREMRKNPSLGNSTLFIDVQSNDLAYKPAQNIGVYPENSDENVAQLCKILSLNPKMKFEVVTKGKAPFPNPISVHNYLKKFCDFMGPVSKKILYELSKLAENQEAKDQLHQASTYKGRELYDEEFLNKKECLLSLLVKYQIKDLKLEQLIELCPLIAPRFFTIASSPMKHPKNIQLICSELLIQGNRLGLCSEFLRTLQKGQTLRCFLQDSAFKYPKNEQSPVLLIGIGAGLAPMRAFIEEKDEYIEKDQLDQCPFKGPMKLFFGCRTKDDYLFGEELQEFEKNGTLNELKVAYSREGEKIYVTKYLTPEFLASHVDMNGTIYICGSSKMGKDVTNCLEDMYKQVKKVMPYLAYRKVNELEQQGLLVKELWG